MFSAIALNVGERCGLGKRGAGRMEGFDGTFGFFTWRENRRLVAFSEEADRQLVNEIQQRDEVLQRIRDLERNISDLRRRRDDRNLN